MPSASVLSVARVAHRSVEPVQPSFHLHVRLSADGLPTDDRTELVTFEQSAGALGAFCGLSLLFTRAKLVSLVQTRVKGFSMRGHIRKRGESGGWEYIVDIGMAAAQRCQDCNRRFWVERRPKGCLPACGGELCETEERRRATKAGFATQKECQAP